MVDHGVLLDREKPPVQVPHRDAIKAKLIEVFHAATPYFF